MWNVFCAFLKTMRAILHFQLPRWMGMLDQIVFNKNKKIFQTWVHPKNRNLKKKKKRFTLGFQLQPIIQKVTSKNNFPLTQPLYDQPASSILIAKNWAKMGFYLFLINFPTKCPISETIQEYALVLKLEFQRIQF